MEITNKSVRILSIKNQVFEDRIRQLVWLYFWLLILEGGLRKWVLPGLAGPLLLVRDPIAIAVFYYGIRRELFASNGFLIFLVVLNLLSFCLTLIVGHGNPFVGLYGIRIGILHFPMMIIMSIVFNREDVLLMGKIILWISIPMTILLLLQFYSPQTAWVNRGIGGDEEGSGFSGAMGFYRSSGTFSFTNGLTLFYGLVSAFVFFFWADNSYKIPQWLRVVSTVCLLLAIPYSISRALLLQVIVTLGFYLVTSFGNFRQVGRIFLFIVVAGTLILALSQISAFQQGVSVFSTRFETANESEGGVQETVIRRVLLAGIYEAVVEAQEMPIFGYGLGYGTRAGAVLLQGDGARYLLAEGEWGRVLGEMGIILGGALVFLRFWLVVSSMIKAFGLVRRGNYLPWMLLGFGFLPIAQGQWSQPTVMGFATIIGGLSFAALNKQAIYE